MVSQLAGVQRGSSFPFSAPSPFSLKGVAGLSFTARIERAHSDRARSESKKESCGRLLHLLLRPRVARAQETI